MNDMATTVKCRRGGVFQTVWIPLVSLNAVRMGQDTRWQRCPVHSRWEIVEKVDPRELSRAEREEAAAHPAGWLP
jgi:hypothetical protein